MLSLFPVPRFPSHVSHTIMLLACAVTAMCFTGVMLQGEFALHLKRANSRGQQTMCWAGFLVSYDSLEQTAPGTECFTSC